MSVDYNRLWISKIKTRPSSYITNTSLLYKEET